MSKLTTFFLGIVVFLLNVWLVYPLFTGEYSQFLQSIEVSYITMARFILSFWPNFSWNPLWYLGYPLYLLYTPLLPFLETVVHLIAPLISLSRAYRLITGLSYCLVPVSLYIFALRVSKRKTAAFIAAVAFSLLPSVNYLNEEVKNVALGFSLAPWRLIILTLYGEGPHTMAQVFLLLAAASFHKLLETRTSARSVLTAILVALVGLTNAIGFFALLILLMVIAFCEIVVGEDQGVRSEKIRSSLQAALLSYGLLAFWYNPLFIKNFFSEGGGVLGNYLALFPWGLVFWVLVAGVVYFLLSRLKDKGLRISSLWFVVVSFIVFSHYRWGVDYAPQALRLMTEVDMALAITLGILTVCLPRGWVKTVTARNLFSLASAVIALAVVFFVAKDFLGLSSGSVRPYSHMMTLPGKKLEMSAEYEISHWLEEHIADDTRVYVSGNYAFWLNFFTDVSQVRGALDQSVVHPWVKHAIYQIYHDKSGEISVAWAKIMNVKYIVVNTSVSRNPFRDYLYPDKFEGFSELVYKKAGDIVYEIPLKSASLAKAVSLSAHNKLEVPRNAIDRKPIFKYVNWLEQARGLSFKKINNGHYRIEGDLADYEGVLVQMSYDPGWQATLVANGVADGENLKVKSDVLGFLLIQPGREGQVVIDLRHRAVIWQYMGYGITGVTLVAIAGLLLGSVRDRLGISRV